MSKEISAVRKILENAYGLEIANNLLDAYSAVVNYFSLEKWKISELDAGHFVETARRIVEIETTGNYTPFDQNLPRFNEQALSSYLSSSTGGDTFRILLPRILWSVYTIRNKRGVAHTGKILSNEMDATYIVSSVKWVLSEIIREKSNLPIPQTSELVSSIVEKQLDILWKDDNIKRVLDSTLSAKDQVLILLYDKSPATEEDLRTCIEYGNASNFRSKILVIMHKKRLINYRLEDRLIHLLPSGLARAEEIILSFKK